MCTASSAVRGPKVSVLGGQDSPQSWMARAHGWVPFWGWGLHPGLWDRPFPWCLRPELGSAETGWRSVPDHLPFLVSSREVWHRPPSV